MFKAGVVGGAGYTGGELCRLLIQHPKFALSQAASQSQKGKFLSHVHKDLAPYTSLTFQRELDLGSLDVVFLCSGHGKGREFLKDQSSLLNHLKIIDLSQDFRLNQDEGFVYGLPETNRGRIIESDRVANPGCFATAIQLALLPLAAHKNLDDDIHVTALTGSTGAGQSPSPSTHFSWRCQNVSTYKSFAHQHLAEINQTVRQLHPGFDHQINFVPMRGPFSRGIFVSMTLKSSLSEQEARKLYSDYYKLCPFVYISPEEPDLKQVINTNHCFVSIHKHSGYIHVISVIDNLIKGAVGQAVQNANLMFNQEETDGLQLKASIY